LAAALPLELRTGSNGLLLAIIFTEGLRPRIRESCCTWTKQTGRDLCNQVAVIQFTTLLQPLEESPLNAAFAAAAARIPSNANV